LAGDVGDRESRPCFHRHVFIPPPPFPTDDKSAPLKASTNRALYPEILSDLEFHVSEALVKNGIVKKQAETIAADMAVYVSQLWGGQLIYFPKSTKFNMANRDVDILKKWNGKNALELCREYNVSRIRLYQILKRPRKKLLDG
jgi:Mor family transcriptional regulator